MADLTEKCDLCGRSFECSPGQVDGRYLKPYKLTVCKNCFRGNWDGLNIRHEEKFIEHLKKEGIPLPERNAKGLFPLESNFG